MVYAITAAFIVLDIISGAIKAIKSKTWSSTVMREGLFHKMGFVIIVALAVICDYGQQYLQLGFTIPLVSGVCAYIILTEIGSVIENVAVINPELIPDKLRSIFIKVKE
jgi:toxin secretion/phage lysis holin